MPGCGGLPGRAELTALARPLGTTAAALLNADEDEPDEAPVGFLTFPRTEQAWRAQARCMRGSGPRTAYALAALCCTVCAALSRAWLFGSVRMACTGFFLAAAAFCLWGCADGPLRLRLRAGVPLAEFQRRYRQDFLELFGEKAKKDVGHGLAGLDGAWLQKQVRAQGYRAPSEIFLLSLDGAGKILCIGKDNNQ